MSLSATINSACTELTEVIYQVRQGVPLTWRSPAAEQFAHAVEDLCGRIESARARLGTAAQLTHLHEAHISTLRTLMGGGGG